MFYMHVILHCGSFMDFTIKILPVVETQLAGCQTKLTYTIVSQNT